MARDRHHLLIRLRRAREIVERRDRVVERACAENDCERIARLLLLVQVANDGFQATVRDASVRSTHRDAKANGRTFACDSLVLRGERCELSACTTELRIERIEVEGRAVYALRDGGVRMPQRGRRLTVARCVRAARYTDCAADSAANDGEEQACRKSCQPPHERGTLTDHA